jgi:hypothetical protein
MTIRINTYEKSLSNPFAINTYKNTGLKVEQNQHLQKTGGRGSPREYFGSSKLRL